ncbi:MAG: hypothetical protein K2H67_04700 [Treponemataceae bacterium]|nr:hypothetical protein [Treponemataceae bacterium]
MDSVQQKMGRVKVRLAHLALRMRLQIVLRTIKRYGVENISDKTGLTKMITIRYGIFKEYGEKTWAFFGRETKIFPDMNIWTAFPNIQS